MTDTTEKTTFVRATGKGALFAKADRDSGEIIKITGEYVTPQGITVYLYGVPLDDGSISLTGTVKDHPRTPVHGLLMPQQYDPDYKMGLLTVGKMHFKLNSKPMEDRNGEPYRFVWTTNNTVRAAF